MAFTAYKPYSENPLVNISPKDMYNNQRVLSGTDPEFLTASGVFFIDTLVIESGKTVTIKDGKDQTIVANMISFSSAKNHIRCDYGVKVTGDVIMLKGYVIENVVKP